MSKERLTSADATRPGYGLRGRLLLSFIAISSFAAIAAQDARNEAGPRVV
jgi:hypothetical protein